jgi:transposase-like protein
MDTGLSSLVEGIGHGKHREGYSKKYTREYKPEAVRMLEAGGQSGKRIEKDLGIGTARDEELVRLRRENALLREDREILRKGVAIFSNPPEMKRRCSSPRMTRELRHCGRRVGHNRVARVMREKRTRSGNRPLVRVRV